MGLDTRGFMDGALRGFDMMERHYDREDRKTDRKDGLRIAQEQRDENDRRYNQSVERQDRLDTQSNERYTTEQARVTKLDAREDQRYKDRTQRQNRADAIAAESHKSQSDYNKVKLSQLQRQQFLADNSVLLDAGWNKYQQTGEVDPIFEDPNVKGGAYDIMRYTPKVLTSFRNVEVNMPKVLAGEMPADSLVGDLDNIYRTNLDAVVGSKDASGKVIASTKLARVTQQSDIDPKREGEQPGLVLAMEVFYEDGSSGGIRPVTNNRSTGADDSVMVIPLESAMKDLTGQLSMARKVATSPYYEKLFLSGKNTKEQREVGKEYRGAINDAHTEYGKAKSKLLEVSVTMAPEQAKLQQEALDADLKLRLGQIETMYGKSAPASSDTGTASSSVPGTEKNAPYLSWANNKDKANFVNGLLDKGQDLSTVTPEMLDAAFKSVAETKKTNQVNTDAESLRQKFYQAQ
ncbi:hypothetical protein GLP37_20315 [Photobacterium phosphoreum]|uniref:hypothetical protein n=1 Tax=Photobacterium phosphoreum TaxID=659 RepID=UPI001E406BA1|nr:hypothetical protein [Photobacterium phosphoreum]MCD9504511.1 hypothetical protein [Photobacterium phosphoreum]